jgi:hypothetical protein
MNRITLCLAYYENPGMLRRQLDQLMACRLWVREQVDLIVVDDGSPTRPALPVFEAFVKDMVAKGYAASCCAEGLFAFSLYRMGVDVPWNMDACRNLAASQAKTDWLLLTDIDHLVPEKTWTKLITAALNPAAAYKFSRVNDPDMSPYKPHPNSWLISRALYDKAGGYDERLAGWYGTDGDFRNAVTNIAPVYSFKEVLIRVPREVTPDASTTTLVRRSPENAAGLDAAKIERAKIKGWRPLRNSFPWAPVLVCSRS